MSDKFRKIVNAPHRVAQKLKEKIQATTPQKKIGKVARGTGITMTATMQFLLWAAKYIALDNHITRALEHGFSEIEVGKNRQGKEKKYQKFIKKNPNFTSIVSWWMFLAVLGGGGQIITDAVRDKVEQNAEDDKFDEEEVENTKYEPGTFGEYFDKLQTITPFVISGLIEYEGVRVNREGLHVVYDDATGKPLKPGQTPKGTATIGFGSTILKDGSRVTSYTKPITNEEAYELVRWHLEEGETYFGMYCYDTAFDNINIDSVPEALAIADIMYNGFSKFIEPDRVNGKMNYKLGNRFANLRKLYKEKGAGLTEEDVIENFQKYPADTTYSFGKAWLSGKPKQEVANMLGNFLKGGPGIPTRRWVEAGLLTGDLSPEVLLDCPIDGLAEFRKYKGSKKSAFWNTDDKGNPVVNKATYKEFIEWLAKPVNAKGQSIAHWKKVRDYMPEYALDACDGKVCELGDKASTKQRVYQKKIERKTYVLDYESAYALAINAYRSGDYNSAAQQLEQLVADNPDNALLHNDLAATYNHLGRYDDAIKHAREIVKRIGDKSQYAAAQYNAGFAYEQNGNLEKALANYKLAVANGNSRVKSDVARVKNKLNRQKESGLKEVAFNEAAARIRQKKQTINQIDLVQSSESVRDHG